MTAKIEAREITKRFGEHVALENLSLEISAGEIFGIIGPNGAGKTTFLRILTGYWLPTSGDVRVDGISVVENPYLIQAKLGYASEQPRLYTDHSVESFLRLMGKLRGLQRPDLQSAVENQIERFGLEEVRKRRIGHLSKGFRQRVSLAQALIHNPPLIVIDEPTVGLDPRQQLDLRHEIQSMAGRHTVILCTHQLSEAEACCDRVALLDRGKLVQIATAEEMRGGGTLEALFLEATRRGELEEAET